MTKQIFLAFLIFQFGCLGFAGNKSCIDLLALENPNGPHLSDLPPSPSEKARRLTYQIFPSPRGPFSREILKQMLQQFADFLKARQMSDVHASFGIDFGTDYISMSGDPEVAKMIRSHFEKSGWIWSGDFNPIAPKINIANELDRLDKLTRDFAEKIYQVMFGTHYRPIGTNNWIIEALTKDQRDTLPKVSELLKLLEDVEIKRKSERLISYNMRELNPIEYTEYENALSRIGAVAEMTRIFTSLSEEGILKVSLAESRYLMALRSLNKISEKFFKGDDYRASVEKDSAEVKRLNADRVALLAKYKAIGQFLFGATGVIGQAYLDPLIRELGFGLLNQIIEKTKLSLLIADPEMASAVRSGVEWAVFNRFTDGIDGKVLHLGPQRIKFLKWVLHEEQLDERSRIAAQNLLRRVTESNPKSEITLLSKTEFEDIYLSFATRVGTTPEPGIYTHGYFVTEPHGMQFEVSDIIVMADLEARHLGIAYANWKNPEASIERVSSRLLNRMRK